MSAIYIFPIQHQFIDNNDSINFMETNSDEKAPAMKSIIEVNTIEKSQKLHDLESQRFW
jgi:hypothetical protein